MKSYEFQCAMCLEIFQKGWSDEQADLERETKVGVAQEDCDLVCDTCWKKTPWGRSEALAS